MVVKKCNYCREEKELNSHNFIKINRGNEVDYLPKCRECSRYEKLSKLINDLSNRRNKNEQ